MDDTDSAEGMCTTFLCYNLVKSIIWHESENTSLLDYPNLIRLNPNIPWKTRGNAALSIRLKTDIGPSEIFRICKNFILKYATSPKANSGLVILTGDSVPEEIQDFSRRALWSVLGLQETRKLISKFNIDFFGLRSQQGLVGALAGIGNLLADDHTYELIAYKQDPELPRKIEHSKIVEMSLRTFPNTFNSYDKDYDRVMIMPHGPDPVLCGIRGETARDVKNAFDMLQPMENLGGWMIFRTNQGTGVHLNATIDILDPKVYQSGKLVACVASKPRAEIGGHVFFNVASKSNEILCACYEPTGDFRRHAMELIPGDIVEVGGGIRKPTTLHPKVLNLEYFKPIMLAKKTRLVNPRCPSCRGSMTSRGRYQGFKCSKCNLISKNISKFELEDARKVLHKLYLPPTKAHRHLTKPIHRFSIKKKYHPTRLIEGWIN